MRTARDLRVLRTSDGALSTGVRRPERRQGGRVSVVGAFRFVDCVDRVGTAPQAGRSTDHRDHERRRVPGVDRDPCDSIPPNHRADHPWPGSEATDRRASGAGPADVQSAPIDCTPVDSSPVPRRRSLATPNARAHAGHPCPTCPDDSPPPLTDWSRRSPA